MTLRALRHAHAGLFASWLAVGCGTAPTDVEGEAPAVIAPPPRPARPPGPPPVRGADGALLESDQTVLGLVLPRGTAPVSEIGTHRVFHSDQPVGLVLAYFGTRLVTGIVERGTGGSATYRNATVSGADPATAVRMDVAIETVSGGVTRIEIIELPPPMLAEPSEEEVRARVEAYIREHGE